MIVGTRARAPKATTQRGYLRSAVAPPQRESVTGYQPSEPIPTISWLRGRQWTEESAWPNQENTAWCVRCGMR